MHGATAEEMQAQTARIEERMAKIKHKVVVMSGKGGVGKTTVSVNLALGLAQKGFKVGILDADIHGPNIAMMLGADEYQIYQTDLGIQPLQINPNLVAISLAFSGHGPDTPIVWRGPMKMGVIRQFLADVAWGDLDYLVIDTPPGTGDEPLSVCQLIPELDGAVIVTTPQDVAILDSRKSINFAKQLNIPVLGVVENMSGYVCPHCGEVVELFGKDGGKKAAEEMEVPFLGAVPLDMAVRSGGDSGKSVMMNDSDSVSAQALLAVVGGVDAALAK